MNFSFHMALFIHENSSLQFKGRWRSLSKPVADSHHKAQHILIPNNVRRVRIIVFLTRWNAARSSRRRHFYSALNRSDFMSFCRRVDRLLNLFDSFIEMIYLGGTIADIRNNKVIIIITSTRRFLYCKLNENIFLHLWLLYWRFMWHVTLFLCTYQRKVALNEFFTTFQQNCVILSQI